MRREECSTEVEILKSLSAKEDATIIPAIDKSTPESIENLMFKMKLDGKTTPSHSRGRTDSIEFETLL
jgi:hypothetical protein